MAATEQTVNTCLIVVEVQLDDEIIVLGALADSVQEVIEMEPEEIEAAPHIGTRLNTDFIKGMGKHDGRFIMNLDIDMVFSADELATDTGVGITDKLPTRSNSIMFDAGLPPFPTQQIAPMDIASVHRGLFCTLSAKIFCSKI